MDCHKMSAMYHLQIDWKDWTVLERYWRRVRHWSNFAEMHPTRAPAKWNWL